MNETHFAAGVEFIVENGGGYSRTGSVVGNTLDALSL